MVVATNPPELRRIAGYGGHEDGGRAAGAQRARLDGGKQTALVLASLGRLNRLQVCETDTATGAVSRYRLLSWDLQGAGRRRLRVALSPIMTDCALDQPQYVTVDLNLARRLETDPGRLLHARLSAAIDPGGSYKFRLASLEHYVWAELGKAADVRALRRERLEATMKKLPRAGWEISINHRGTYVIKRPALPNTVLSVN